MNNQIKRVEKTGAINKDTENADEQNDRQETNRSMEGNENPRICQRGKPLNAYINSHSVVNTSKKNHICEKQDVSQGYRKDIVSARDKVQQEKASRPPKKPPEKLISSIQLSKDVYEQIKETIGSCPVETGGLLLGNLENLMVTGFIFDDEAYKNQRSSVVWYPHTESLNNRVLQAEKKGLSFLGVVHSHPRGIIHPSGPDKWAAWSNMTSKNNPHLNAYIMPIVQSSVDGPFGFHPYVAICHPEGMGRIILTKVNLKLV